MGWGVRCEKQMKISSIMVCDGRRGISYICIIYLRHFCVAQFFCKTRMTAGLVVIRISGNGHGIYVYEIWGISFPLKSKCVNGQNCAFSFLSSDAVFNLQHFFSLSDPKCIQSSLCGIKPFCKWKNLKIFVHLIYFFQCETHEHWTQTHISWQLTERWYILTSKERAP